MAPSFTRAQAQTLSDLEANDRFDREQPSAEDVIVNIISYDNGQLHIALGAGAYGVVGYTNDHTVALWDSEDTASMPRATAMVPDTSDMISVFAVINPMISLLF